MVDSSLKVKVGIEKQSQLCRLSQTPNKLNSWQPMTALSQEPIHLPHSSEFYSLTRVVLPITGSSTPHQQRAPVCQGLGADYEEAERVTCEKDRGKNEGMKGTVCYRDIQASAEQKNLSNNTITVLKVTQRSMGSPDQSPTQQGAFQSLDCSQ